MKQQSFAEYVQQSVKADLSFDLTEEQLELLQPLLDKREWSKGMILGSVSVECPKVLSLSYVPYDTAKKIVRLAFEELGGKDVNS